MEILVLGFAKTFPNPLHLLIRISVPLCVVNSSQFVFTSTSVKLSTNSIFPHELTNLPWSPAQVVLSTLMWTVGFLAPQAQDPS